MGLLEDVKVSLRLSSDAMDTEVQDLINAARKDMERVGIDPTLLDDDGNADPLAKVAVTLYCKAHFGYDNDEAARFQQSYRQTVIDMLNAPTSYAPR